jgi:hypothetical protein
MPRFKGRREERMRLCYIGAMLLKGLALSAVLLALQQTPSATIPRQADEFPVAAAQSTPASPAPVPQTQQAPAVQPAGNSPTGARPSPAGAASPPATPAYAPRPAGQPNAVPRQYPARPTANTLAPAPQPAGEADCGGAPCETPRPLVVNTPPPAPVVWSMHEKIAWAAYVVLAFLGYAGIMLAISTLKKIERQTAAAETAAIAAQNAAQAALMNAQAVIDADRPWLVVSVEPSPTVENGFMVTATNRGRSPARIVATAEQLRIAVDETRLPAMPEYGNSEPVPPMVPIILLQGESTGLKSFSRSDARELCESDEQFARIESWEEKIFLYGRVLYNDLVAPPDRQAHQTDWCSWYIHGRQRSGLVMGGPKGYNVHT